MTRSMNMLELEPMILYTDMRSLFPKQSSHSPQNAILFWIIRVVFARYLKKCGKRCRVRIDSVSYFLGDLQPC